MIIFSFSSPRASTRLQDKFGGNKSTTEVRYLDPSSNKSKSKRQRSGLSTSVPLPPITKGKWQFSYVLIVNFHIICYHVFHNNYGSFQWSILKMIWVAIRKELDIKMKSFAQYFPLRRYRAQDILLALACTRNRKKLKLIPMPYIKDQIGKFIRILYKPFHKTSIKNKLYKYQ